MDVKVLLWIWEAMRKAGRDIIWIGQLLTVGPGAVDISTYFGDGCWWGGEERLRAM